MSLRASFRNHEANSWTILFLTQRLCQSQYWDGPLLPILQPSSCHKSQRCASPCCCTPINLFRGIIYHQKHALSMLVAAIFSPYDELFNINWFFKMKTYMPLNGLRWSRNSGSANCDMPQSAVFGRPGGVKSLYYSNYICYLFNCYFACYRAAHHIANDVWIAVLSL